MGKFQRWNKCGSLWCTLADTSTKSSRLKFYIKCPKWSYIHGFYVPKPLTDNFTIHTGTLSTNHWPLGVQRASKFKYHMSVFALHPNQNEPAMARNWVHILNVTGTTEQLLIKKPSYDKRFFICHSYWSSHRICETFPQLFKDDTCCILKADSVYNI